METSQILTNIEHERRLRIAVIGCGGHTYRNIFPSFQYAPVELVAVCDLNEERVRDCARVFGARQVYTDYRQMLKRETLDAAFVVTQTDEMGLPRYPAIACDVLNAGVHAWIEKPPAASSDEIHRMLEASGRSGRFVGVGFKKMFAPANVKARELSQREEFGRVTSLSARYPQHLPPAVERSDSRKMASFLDHIVHPYSAIRLLGGDIDSLVFDRCAHNGASTTLLKFTSGAVGTLVLSNGQSGLAPLERTEIVGEGANIVVENNLRVTFYRAGRARGGYGRAPSFYDIEGEAPQVFEPEFSLGNLYNKGLFMLGYVPEINAFCEAVLAGHAPSKGNLQDALALTQIYEAYRRGTEGEVIQVGKA